MPALLDAIHRRIRCFERGVGVAACRELGDAYREADRWTHIAKARQALAHCLDASLDCGEAELSSDYQELVTREEPAAELRQAVTAGCSARPA